MVTRTAIEIDEQLLDGATRALGHSSARAPSEVAPRRAAEQAENEHTEQAARQLKHLESLSARVDLDVLASEEMWR